MKAFSFRSLALASLASLAMATSSSAATVLQYTQANPNTEFKSAVAAGGVTTITTTPGSILVNIGNIGNIPLSPAPGPNQVFQAFETFTNVRSTGPATQVGNEIRQSFAGTISYTSLPGGAGTNYLTATFVDAVLFGQAGGSSASLVDSDPPSTDVNYTSSDPRVLALFSTLGPNLQDNFSISFTGLGGLGITGTGANATISNFTARNAGSFDTQPVPEPSGVVLAGTAFIASLGCYGWRRRQSSQA
jgi:hypothetical protein